jgi:hypothetical protein
MTHYQGLVEVPKGWQFDSSLFWAATAHVQRRSLVLSRQTHSDHVLVCLTDLRHRDELNFSQVIVHFYPEPTAQGVSPFQSFWLKKHLNLNHLHSWEKEEENVSSLPLLLDSWCLFFLSSPLRTLLTYDWLEILYLATCEWQFFMCQ